MQAIAAEGLPPPSARIKEWRRGPQLHQLPSHGVTRPAQTQLYPAPGVPPLPDDAMVSIARFLSAKDLCSLECAARRFWVPEYSDCSLAVPRQEPNPQLQPTSITLANAPLAPLAPLRWSMAEEAALDGLGRFGR